MNPQPNEPDPRRGIAAPRLLVLLAAVVLLPLALLAAQPSWWSDRGVLTSGTANDYAAANQGQVKNIAVAAIEELEGKLPPEAVAYISGTLKPILTATSNQTNDYTAVNLGQLKAVAQPILQCLIDADYTGHPLVLQSGTYTFPWLATTSGTANDYAMANIGQVKNLFAFDLSTVSSENSDSDDLPDWWELEYFGDLSHDGSGDYENDGFTNAQEYAAGTSPSAKDNPAIKLQVNVIVR